MQTIQYTYYPISQDAMAIRQWILVSLSNIGWEIFFFKSHAENETGRLVLDFFVF